MPHPPSTRPPQSVTEATPPAGATADDDLASLPKPPRQMRTLSVALLMVAGIAAGSMAYRLANDVRYALGTAVPVDVGKLAALKPTGNLQNTFVQGEGVIDAHQALRYERPFEPDAFLIAPVTGNDRLWVEMRAPMPAASSSAAGVPLANFVGRLVPVRERGFRHGAPARASADSATAPTVPSDAWVLLDGVTPRSLQWTIPLLALFLAFAGFSAFHVVRIVRPVRA